jgi:hypothetical protein
MANPDNLTNHQFTSENQPKNRRSRKGVPNRSTIVTKWLRSKAAIPQHLLYLLPGGRKQTGTVEDVIALALIARAARGNVPAIKEVMDSVYGKVTDKQEISGSVEVGLSLEEFKQCAAERRRQIADLDDDEP